VSPVDVAVLRLPHAEGLPLPSYATAGAAGADVVAAVASDLVLAPGVRVAVPTGLVFAVPEGFEMQVRPRSGMALHHGVTVANAPGTVDSDYRGEVCVILHNFGTADFVVRRGDRIAQLVIAPLPPIELVEEDALDETDRGSGGFGHTG